MPAVVFDTGEHGVGGRAATRTTTDPSIHSDWIPKDSSSSLRAAGLLFDHAAQCFTATDPAFKQQCEAWVAAGAAKHWEGPVGTLKPGGVFEPLGADVAVYVATDGMRQLSEHMAAEVCVNLLAVLAAILAWMRAMVPLFPNDCYFDCALESYVPLF
jgi:predicted NAD/FAD-dependent oxidoreductase